MPLRIARGWPYFHASMPTTCSRRAPGAVLGARQARGVADGRERIKACTIMDMIAPPRRAQYQCPKGVVRSTRKLRGTQPPLIGKEPTTEAARPPPLGSPRWEGPAL